MRFFYLAYYFFVFENNIGMKNHINFYTEEEKSILYKEILIKVAKNDGQK